jgi:Transposase and inactivated derivatives
VLEVNRRSYYKWCKIGKPIANNFNSITAEIISKEHENNKGIYGVIRLKYAIQNKLGIVLNHKLIRRYKELLGLETVKRTKKGLSVSRAKEKNLTNKAQYLIECNFKSDRFGQKFSSDVSYIKCKDGTLYLSAIKDYFNNEIVSFFTSIHNDVNLIKESYNNLKPAKDAVVNTDQGAVYFAYEYIELAEKIGFTRSMSHRGHCWENCPIENWFMQLKHEWLCQFSKLTKKEAAEEIKKYVQWYNSERIQKKLGYLSPVEYRLKYS